MDEPDPEPAAGKGRRSNEQRGRARAAGTGERDRAKLVVDFVVRQRELEGVLTELHRSIEKQGVPLRDSETADLPPEQAEDEERAGWEARAQLRELIGVLLQELEARLKRLGDLGVRFSDEERATLAEVLQFGAEERSALARMLRLPEEDRRVLAVALRLSDEECRALAEFVRPTTRARTMPEPVVTIVDPALTDPQPAASARRGEGAAGRE